MLCKPLMKTDSHSFPFTSSQLPVKALTRQNDLQACVMKQLMSGEKAKYLNWKSIL